MVMIYVSPILNIHAKTTDSDLGVFNPIEIA